MALRLYNSRTRQKEEFQTLETGKVKMYVCGPTVYNYFHIGNARAFVVFDVVRRYLEYRGYQVTYVQNFTDVDDKLIRKSQEMGKTVKEVADQYIDAYFEDVEALGVKRADVHPRVMENMDEIIQMIQELIAKGFAYVREGDVYYNTLRFSDYGKLSNQSLEDLQAGARIEVNENKQNPLDFTLWKAAKPSEVFWDSPWGQGRPGWHIECSAMNRKYLGEEIDIHGGGHDLMFPHHENELAQSQAATGKPLARYWLHNGYVNINNEKMSKSLGNSIFVRDLKEQYAPLALRFFLLSAQYRHPVNFSDESIRQSQQAMERISGCLESLRHRAASADPDLMETIEVQPYRERFCAAMDDDLNTPDAITVIFEVVKDANQYMRKEHVALRVIETYQSILEELAGVLGFQFSARSELLDEDIERLIAERTNARKEKNFARADEIRNQLVEQGILLEDTPQGVRWRRQT
ncbi:cysteine--tRNA ligase [Fodinisporobacter ferrooxydans]|uniref:Cysteine--tRNA ligase n=1 Tax=Fodinisporobacter ferrooxydans TaxID=2901836 RepID=A0ABY4CN08_9BACL|nr:cysteine--tRNA ligase [Alicyclobacillaceae bacterium MYW30-H2]